MSSEQTKATITVVEEEAGSVQAVAVPVEDASVSSTVPAITITTTTTTTTTTTATEADELGFDPSLVITQVPEPPTPATIHHHPHKLRKPSTVPSSKVAPIPPKDAQSSLNQQQKDAKATPPFFKQLQRLFCGCCGADDVESTHSGAAIKTDSVVSSTAEIDLPQVMKTDDHLVKKKESNLTISKESVLEDGEGSHDPIVTPFAEPLTPPTSDDGSVEYLLPKILPEDVGKKCLVLDLDETLVHSSFKPVPNADFVIPIDIEGTFHNVYVLKRPHVDSFLENLGKEFEVVVFTASMSNYANPVLDLLDRSKVIKHRLFREHCVYYNGAYVKDLSMLGRPLTDCIIVDNAAYSYAFQPENAVPCQSWYNDMEDDELLELQPFMMGLKTIPDVRTVLGVDQEGNGYDEEDAAAIVP